MSIKIMLQELKIKNSEALIQKHKILVDLSLLTSSDSYGYRGVSKDLALIFKAISKIKTVERNILLYPPSYKQADFYVTKNMNTQNYAQALAVMFKDGTNDGEEAQSNVMIKHCKNIISFIQNSIFLLKHLSQRTFTLAIVPTNLFKDYLWRKVFSKIFMISEYRELIENSKFYLSNLSGSRLKFSSLYNINHAKIDTTPFDFIILQEPKDIRVSKNTIKIIRYHDAMQLKNPDIMFKKSYTTHYQAVKFCKDDSIFICNSEPSKNDLISIFPEVADRTYVIPCILHDTLSKKQDFEKLKIILQNRLSDLYLSTTSKNYLISAIQKLDSSNFKYIFNLATIEPKKNLKTLVNAWQDIYQKYGIHLVICGSPNYGWKELTKEIGPHIKKGSIIHIEKLAPEELSFLYSHAEAFIFPSYDEGFGMPVLEAMQCECPTIISDIPAHRWVNEDSTLYFDPYNVDDLRNKITILLYSKKSLELRKMLIKKGLERTKLYSIEQVAKMWSDLLDKLKVNN